MKKFLVILGALIIFSSNCFAMTFSQPVKIGEVGVAGGPRDGIEIIGATSIKDYSTKKKKGSYMKGMAIFGKSLRFYFNKEYYWQNSMKAGTNLKKIQKLDSEVSRFGGANVKNTVPIFTFEGQTNIYQIKNDGGIELYLAQTETGGGGSIQVFGTTKEGKWVKYFDVRDARKSFGIPRSDYIENFFTVNDEIIFQYVPGRWEQDGELRYKWDEKAKWFGVENKTCADLLADMRKNPSNYYCHGGGGTGLSFWFDKNSVRAKKTDNGCIISVRPLKYYAVAGVTNPRDYMQYATPSIYFPLRFFYNFKTKKIYAEKFEKNYPAKWEIVNTNPRGRDERNILSLTEQAFYIAYNRNFFNKPYSYQGVPIPRGGNF